MPKKRVFLLPLLTGILLLSAIIPNNTEVLSSGRSKKSDAKYYPVEVFANIKGSMGAGIFFDRKDRMLIAKKGGIDQVTPDGTVSVFCDFSDIQSDNHYYFNSPLVWGMVTDREGNILAAAQDRILKITGDGNVTTLIADNFDGFSGASDIELDRQGNIYITNGSKIVRYDSDLKPTVFIDTDGQYITFFSIKFDQMYNYLYVSDFNSKAVLKYPINPDGSAGEPIILVKTYKITSFGSGAPLNITFGPDSCLYISLDISSQVLRVKPNGDQELLKMDGLFMNHFIAFGGEGFDENSLYFSTFEGESVFKMKNILKP